MTKHKTGTRDEWRAARLELLAAEKELTRRSDELAQRRQELPWVRDRQGVPIRHRRGERDAGRPLPRGARSCSIYHFMFGPDYKAGCPSCSAIADGFDGSVVHLANHDVTLMAVSRAPLAKLQAYKRRMGWSFPWASSFGSDFNVRLQRRDHRGAAAVGRRRIQLPRAGRAGGGGAATGRGAEFAAGVGTDWPTYVRERPGMSTFVREDGAVYHTYSAYARGLDGLWGMYQWLDRAPLGRNETGLWWRRHDEYDKR